MERAGLPTAQICTILPVAQMVGSNRIVPGNGIVHPTGDGAASATGMERAGLPTAQTCRILPVARMVGSNRIVPGNGIVHPTGDAERTPDEERRIRRRLGRRPSSP